MLLRYLKSLSRSLHFRIAMSHKSPSDTPEGPCVLACARDLLGIGRGFLAFPLPGWSLSYSNLAAFVQGVPHFTLCPPLPPMSPVMRDGDCFCYLHLLPSWETSAFIFLQILKASGLVQEPQIWESEVCTFRGFNCVFLRSAGEKVGPDACLICSFRETAGCSALSSEWEKDRMGKEWHRVGSCDTQAGSGSHWILEKRQVRRNVRTMLIDKS